MEKQLFSEWAIVELFGHTRIAGLVGEQVIAGQGFIRVDVPKTNGQEAFTRLLGPGAIYSIIPTTQEIATAFVRRNVGAPISPYELALPAPKVMDDRRTWDDTEDISDEDEDEDDGFDDTQEGL